VRKIHLSPCALQRQLATRAAPVYTITRHGASSSISRAIYGGSKRCAFASLRMLPTAQSAAMLPPYFPDHADPRCRRSAGARAAGLLLYRGDPRGGRAFAGSDPGWPLDSVACSAPTGSNAQCGSQPGARELIDNQQASPPAEAPARRCGDWEDSEGRVRLPQAKARSPASRSPRSPARWR
jgi:hypothetical protein